MAADAKLLIEKVALNGIKIKLKHFYKTTHFIEFANAFLRRDVGKQF